MKLYRLKQFNYPEWNNVEDFCDWYVENRFPINIPSNYEVFLSDDATAVPIFRVGNFQVEMYLIHPQPRVPIHEHPGVEVIKLRIYTEGDELVITASDVLHKNQSHGVGMQMENEKKGFILLAVQHWIEHEPCTVAATWKGKTVGPLQEKLVKRFFPEAIVLDGYADITKKLKDIV